jgi:hypothetical protein
MLVGNTPVLERPIDLKSATDLESLLAFIKTNEKHFDFSYQEAVSGLTAFIHMVPILGPLRMVVIDSVNIRINKSRTLSLWLSWVVELGNKILDMAACEQISTLLDGFKNPTQIESSIYETNIAHYCFSLPGVTNLRFNQKIATKRGAKYPEFVFTAATEDVVCECKLVKHDEHGSTRRFINLCGRLFYELGKIGIPTNTRVDVALEKPIGDTDSAIEELRRAIQDALAYEGQPVITIGSFRFRLSSRKEPPSFEDYDICQSNLDAGKNPTAISTHNALSPNSTIWVCTTDKKFRKAVGSLMNDAMRQLPEDKAGVIFVGTPNNASIRQAANVRLSDRTYRHILCVVLMDPKTFIYRIEDREKIRAIFGDEAILS